MIDFINTMIDLATEYQSLLLTGIYRTLILGIVGTVAGLIIGLIVGALRVICVKHEPTEKSITKGLKWLLNAIMNIYITIFRGTPMIVQAMIIYFGVFDLGLQWDPFIAGLVVISVNTGAYMAEIIRSGIQSIDAGQEEAARSVGMSGMQAMRYVVLPQAIRNAFPSIGNELIVNIKDCCTLSTIMITELFYQARTIAGSTYKTVPAYMIAAIIYLILTSLASFIMKKLEKRINHTESNYFASSTVVENMENQ